MDISNQMDAIFKTIKVLVNTTTVMGIEMAAVDEEGNINVIFTYGYHKVDAREVYAFSKDGVNKSRWVNVKK